MDQNKEQARDKMLFRVLSFDQRTINTEERTIEASISSEIIVSRWWGAEVLGHEPGDVRLGRIKTVGSFLFAHGRDVNYGVLPVGTIVNVWLDQAEKKLRATLKFDTDDRSEVLWKKVLGGSLRGISIGYIVYKWLEVKAGETERGYVGPISIAVDWEPYEISLEPTPADSSVGVGRSEEKQEERNDKKMGNEVKEPEVRTAEDVTNQPVVESQQDKTSNEAEIRNEASNEATKAERARVTEITAMCRSFGIDSTEYIDSGRSVEDVSKIVLEKLAEERKAVPVVRVEDEADKFKRAVIDGIALRCGVGIEKPAEGSNRFRGARLIDIAKECAERATGRKFDYGDNDQIIRAAITGTSEFPLIMSNIANKSMLTGFQMAETTFQRWTKKGELSDFKPATRVRLSEADELTEMTEHGEFKHSEFTEGGVTIQLGTYGRSFSLTRKAIINDDLSVLNDIPMKYGASARRLINRLVYEKLINNVKMDDNKTLFHADHKNLAGMGAAPSIDTLSDGRAAMRKQKNIGGKEFIRVTPAFVLVPVELETLTDQLLSSLVDPTKSNQTPNPFTNKLTSISDPEIIDPDAWYLAAAPGLFDTIEVAYLNGVEEPHIESAVVFDMLGVKYRVWIDFGIKVLDFRGLYKNPGK